MLTERSAYDSSLKAAQITAADKVRTHAIRHRVIIIPRRESLGHLIKLGKMFINY